MRHPRAVPTKTEARDPDPRRAPRAYETTMAEQTPHSFEDEVANEDENISPAPRRQTRFWRTLALATGGALISLGLGLAADRLIRDLFAAYDWLGWVGLGLLTLFVVAMAALIAREVFGLLRLRKLDRLRSSALAALENDSLPQAQTITSRLLDLYSTRPDLARRRAELETDRASALDGAELIRTAERVLMGALDARAKALTAASARRVALVTAVSPRALIDITFVVFESFRLARNLADLYGARPGFFGFLRLIGSILAHLAVTGGLVLTDGVLEQLVGQGLATKLSARLGEGLVNSLMTVRVGIAAMRVVRPLPFDALKSPAVTDFVGDLADLRRATS